MEKLENKLIDMREMYQEHKERVLNGLVIILKTILNAIKYEF